MSDTTITRRLNIFVNGREVENNISAISSAQRRLLNEMRRLDRGAADYAVRQREMVQNYRRLTAEQENWRASLRETPGFLSRMRSSLGGVATGMLAAFSIQGLVSGFASKIREAWNTVKEFDQKQADLAAVLGVSRIGVAKLTADAIKYGSTTSYNATQVSELQTELARLGKTQSEIRGMTEDVLNSATALEAGLGPAAELVGGQLNSYGENATAAQKYSDIMANSVNISATSFASLSTALPKVSAVAAENNVSFERLNATLGVLADRNVAAETAGTGFRNILLTAAQEGKPYEELLQKVAKSTDKTRTATELFGKENATVAVIMATSTDKINANTKALENSAGAAAKLAEEKLRTIKGAAENFSGAWEGLILSIEKGDGLLSKAATGILNMGSIILNSITPMRQLSDEIKDQQVALNVLVGKITSTNIKEDERKRLIIELNEQYPDFIKNIDAEKVSNEDLKKELIKVNEEYNRRLLLQRQVEKRDAAQKALQGMKSATDDYLLDFAQRLAEIAVNNKINFTVDYGNIEKSAKELQSKLKASGARTGIFSDYREIKKTLQTVALMNESNKDANKRYQEQEEILKKVVKQTGLKTEDEIAAAKALKEQQATLAALRKEAEKLGMKNASSATEQEARRYINAYKERLKYAGENEEEKKAREKKAAALQKERERRIREEEALNKDLLASQKAANDANLDIMAEGYEKERNQANEEFAQKIADLKMKMKTEAEIKLVQDKLSAAKKSGKSDQVAYYQEQLNDMLTINKNYNAAITSAEQQRMVRIAAIQEKYLKKEVQRQEEANQSELNSLKIAQNNELSQFDSLQKAKATLSQYLSSDELAKVKTLEDAKLAIKNIHAKQEYEMQEKHLVEIMALWEGLLAQESDYGVPVFSEEQRKDILKFLDDAALKLSEIRAGKADNANQNSGSERDSKINLTSGLDVLGKSPDEWEAIFKNVDTYKEKLQAVSAVAGALQQAFSTYFNYMNTAEQGSLTKYEKSVNRKKKALQDQLDRGYISQDLYNARVAKLDQDLEAKKARLAYKQAKRERAMSIASIVSSTALAIMSIWAQFPKVDFGVTAGIMSGVVAALGAAQLATVVATPLPSPDGFKKGGYTGDGNANDIAGPAHKREYVVPENVLFSTDPEVPRIISYLEAKRTGKQGYKNGGATTELPTLADSSPETASSDPELLAALNRNTDVMEKILSEGISGYVVVDVPAAKKIKQKINEYESIQNAAKK